MHLTAIAIHGRRPIDLPTRPGVRVIRRTTADVDPRQWDAFVDQAGGSFRESWSIVGGHRVFGGLRIFEFELDEAPGAKIGQCAIVGSRAKAIFLDRIQLLPQFDDRWTQCFHAVVRQVCARKYVYGSLWNQERPRAPAIDGLTISAVPEHSFHIDIIDFAKWNSFDNYYRAVSENVRREFTRAQRSGAVRIDILRGQSAITAIPSLIRTRRHVERKHGLAYKHARDWWSDFLNCAAKLIAFGNRAYIARAMVGRDCLATFYGIEQGSRLYYITGGTKPNREGAGSYLLLKLIQEWFDKAPSGQFVFGHCMGHADPSIYDEGALLYRRKLRASAVEGLHETITVDISGADVGAKSRKISVPSESFPPKAYIIGAQKAGTSSLAYLLAQHPAINLARDKEVDFFSTHWDRGIEWYRAQFAPKPGATILLDASPSYSAAPLGPYAPHQIDDGRLHIPERIAALRPDARLIYILRDPVERTYSSYWQAVRSGYEDRPLELALQRDPEYVYGSLYCEQLEHFLKVFSRDSVLLVNFGDLKRNPAAVARRCLAFLGAEPVEFEFRDMRPRNTGFQYNALGTLLRKTAGSERALERISSVARRLLAPRLYRYFTQFVAKPVEGMDARNRAIIEPYVAADCSRLIRSTGITPD